MPIHYILNRGDWTAFHRHEEELYWDKNRAALRAGYFFTYVVIFTTIFGSMTAGFFFFIRWLALRSIPSTPESAAGVAWFGAAVFWFAWGIATVIVIPWKFDEMLRSVRRKRVAQRVKRAEKSGHIHLGKRYLLTVSPSELHVTSTLESLAAGFSFAQREEYHIAWDTVYAVEVISNLLIVRTNYLVIILPSHAFASHVEFYRQVAEIQRYLGEEHPCDDGRERTDVERPTTFKRKGPVQL